jgi:hypothetical protein
VAGSVTTTSMAIVSEPAVQVTGSFAFAAVEGNLSASQTVATFTDPAGPEAVGNYAAQIDWGDGSMSAGSIAFDPATQVFSVNGAHTYAEDGSDRLTVTIAHETASTVVVMSTATVADAPLSFGASSAPAAAEGVAFSGAIASFIDSNPNPPLSDFSAMIQWGDGASSSGSVSIAGNAVTTAKQSSTSSARPSAWIRSLRATI